MTTHLASHPLDASQLSLLDAIADSETPLGSLHRDDFRAACVAVAVNGLVDPNKVSAWLHERFGEVSPRWYSAMWAPACGPRGFLDKTSLKVQIDPKHSRGNGGKEVFYRRLRVTS